MEVGDIINIDGVSLLVCKPECKDSACEECYFYDGDSCIKFVDGPICEIKDGEDVIFKLVEDNEISLISAVRAREMSFEGAKASIHNIMKEINEMITKKCKAGDFMIQYGHENVSMSTPEIYNYIIQTLRDNGYKVTEEYRGKIIISW